MEESTTLEQRPRVYDHIPQLWELMPNTRGLPGVEYAQCATANTRPAHDKGWEKTLGPGGRPLLPYTIEGPRGSVDCELLSTGEPIRGQDATSGARMCWVDNIVYEVTGFPNPALEGSPITEPGEDTQ
jgi:hypothetical protein